MQYKDFCRIIKVSRIDENISQKDFAISIGLTQSNYCKIENGDLEPNFLTLCKIIKALKIDFNKIIREEEVQTPLNFD